MFQEEPHPDIESMTDAEHGAATVADVVTKQAKDGIPNLDYDTMPASTNIEDRRGEAATAARSTGKGGQLFDSGNQDVQELTDYLQHLKDTETKAPEQSTHTHPAETDGTLNRLLANTAAGKLAEWGAYAGLANAAPKVLPALNALWMGAWIASGHQLRADIEKQVKEGKSLSEIKFEKGSLGDMGGIISALQEKYAKPNDQPQQMSRINPDKPLLDIPGGGVPTGNIKGRITLDERGNLSKEVLDNNARLTARDEGWFRPGGTGWERPDLLQIRIRQMEYDRRLSGYKRGDDYQGNGEISRLRTRLKELSK